MILVWKYSLKPVLSDKTNNSMKNSTCSWFCWSGSHVCNITLPHCTLAKPTVSLVHSYICKIEICRIFVIQSFFLFSWMSSEYEYIGDKIEKYIDGHIEDYKPKYLCKTCKYVERLWNISKHCGCTILGKRWDWNKQKAYVCGCLRFNCIMTMMNQAPFVWFVCLLSLCLWKRSC